MPKMKLLVQYTKEAGIGKKYLGHHAHLSEVTDKKLSNKEARKQVNITQSHTNYQVSMMTDE